MASHADERSELTNRILPQMSFARADDGHFDKARIDLTYPDPRDSAPGRFSISRYAIVTSSTGGIGMTVARAMLQHGLSGLVIFDPNVAASSERVEALKAQFPGTKIETMEVDVTDEEQVRKAVAETANLLGSVDMLVCFAGIVCSTHTLDMPISQFRKIIDVNTTGTFICAQAAARQMVAQGTRGGRIVLTAPISAHRVNFPQPQAAYNVSKAAVVMLKSCLAAEWARYGITVNSVSPGYMDTVLNEGPGLAGRGVRGIRWGGWGCQRRLRGRM